ncbi:uncharacterized protein LOC112345597 [Selaginella moellendorffii]|uniref:uncharacterized protein LOC112345597 n=1 Tax=Selaginella moellendorffii TaxID=88036 RepID=UPI000D1C728A|nr:uncharacterized protein LOC112345597 [Selaginella moellendorffii]|eukprot:XP_024528489.1 uncharacterized protein LOC112345597 [Selaginella moellendorffii]
MIEIKKKAWRRHQSSWSFAALRNLRDPPLSLCCEQRRSRRVEWKSGTTRCVKNWFSRRISHAWFDSSSRKTTRRLEPKAPSSRVWMWRRRCCDDVPDELLIRIMSLLPSSRDLHSSSLVSKRWARLARLVTHLCLDSSSPGVEQGLARWFGHHNSLRQLSIQSFFQHQPYCSSTRWLHQVGKSLHSLSISSTSSQHKFDGFWSNVSACQELRCLHVHGKQLAKLGDATLPSPLLPNLLFLTLRTKVDVTSLQQLLDLCPSLLVVRMNGLLVRSPGTYVLKSRTLVSCQSEGYFDGGLDNVTIVLDAPKLRWMFLVAPRIVLLPATCNIDWIRMTGIMGGIQGLRYSRLTKLAFINPFYSSAQVMDKVARYFACRKSSLRGIKTFCYSVFDDGIPLFSIDLAALLEPFQGLEMFIISFKSIKLLNVANCTTPLTVIVEYFCVTHVWESEGPELEVIRELLRRSSGTTLELRGFYIREDVNPEIPPLLQELPKEFPGRVKLPPLQLVPRPTCGILWRSWQTSVAMEDPYTGFSNHWCNLVYGWQSERPCAWE